MNKFQFIIASGVLIMSGACSSNDTIDEIIDDNPSNTPSIENNSELFADPYNYTYVPKVTSKSDTIITKPGASYFPEREQYVYLSQGERHDRLQVSAETVKSMNTYQLVDLCMSYPDNSSFLVYNNYDHGIMSVIKWFRGFEELKSRSDAFDKLLYYYSKKLDDIKKNGAKVYTDIKFLSRFMEYFMITGYLYPVDKLQECVAFKNLVLKAAAVKEKYEDFKSGYDAQVQYDMEYVAGFHPDGVLNFMLFERVPDGLLGKK